MKVAVISDLHIDLRGHCAQDAVSERCIRNIDADKLIVCGDITENAEPSEWNAFFRMIKPNFDASQLYIAPGNMDKAEEDDGKSAYIREYPAYSDILPKSLYFCHETDECVVIGIATEPDDDIAPLSDAQINMLEDGIRSAEAKRIPALVFGYYILNDTVDVDRKYAFLGEQSRAVRSIPKQYDNTYYFSGHIHRGFISRPGGSVVKIRGVTLSAFPRYASLTARITMPIIQISVPATLLRSNGISLPYRAMTFSRVNLSAAFASKPKNDCPTPPTAAFALFARSPGNKNGREVSLLPARFIALADKSICEQRFLIGC